MSATFKTNSPRAFAQFFSEERFDKLAEEQKLFEKCHGERDTINVVFFEDVPGECSKEIKTDTRYSRVLNYHFCDEALSKESYQRSLHVTVVL